MSRLLSVNNYHYRRGGSEVVFLEHDAMFRARGWDTAVFSMKHPMNLPSEWQGFFVDEIEYDRETSVWARLQQAGKVVWSSETIANVDRLLDRFPADLLHAHGVYHHLSPSVLYAAKRRGIPTVMTQHDLKLACPAYKMLNAGGVCEKCRSGNLLNVIASRCIRNSTAASAVVFVETTVHRAFKVYPKYVDRLLAPSRFYLEKLVEWGWDRNKLRYVPNFVDADRFRPAFEPGRYVLYFGRLSIEKGVTTLLRAANHARVPLVIAGTGPLDAELRAQASSLGADVSFVGFKTGEALHDLIRDARVVVLPSEWYENAPMAVLESFALGKPVIGASIGGIPEMIDTYKTGLVFRSGDVEDLARCLREVADASPQTLRDMGREARNFVADRFTEHRYYQAVCAVYAELGVKAPDGVPA
jgi:glycosyltransferase involved in cell wall biosynthesis